MADLLFSFSAAAPAPPQKPVIYRHIDLTDWGRGVLVAERDGKRFFHFEDGKPHAIVKSHFEKVVPIEIAEDEARGVAEALATRFHPVAPRRSSKGRTSRPVAPSMSFAQQVERFEKLFPAGFSGEAFVAEERGQLEPGGKGVKAMLIAKAATALTHEALSGDAQAAFAAVRELLQRPNNLLHVIEGYISFGKIKEEERGAVVAALDALLHGEGERAARFDAFVATLKLSEKDGTVKPAGWPLSTVFAALAQPAEQLFVKPTFMKKQAAILGVALDLKSLPNGADYGRLLEVAKQTEHKLREAGHQPRDLMDVYSFVSSTLRA